jgi:hypothetical protein
MPTPHTNAITHEYPVLLRYLGHLRFSGYVDACGYDGMSWKQTADSLPESLLHVPSVPLEVAELARLERAMRKAFEAGMDGNDGPRLLHPSVSLLTFEHNTSSLWSALICGEPPSRPYRLETPQHVVTWRHKGQARMRLLGQEEYNCMIALAGSPHHREASAETAMPAYMAGWLENDVVLPGTLGPVAK